MNRNTLRLAFPTLALFAALGPAFAQPAPADTPVAGARRSLLALKEDRLEDFTASMHPEALASFRGMLLPVVEAAAKEGKQAEVLSLFDGPADVEAVKKLTEPQFYTSFMRKVLTPDLKASLAGANYRFLGHVQEGETAHVAYRVAISIGEGKSIALPSIISLKKRGAEWAALLTGDVEGMPRLLAQHLAGTKPAAGELKTEPKLIGHVMEGKDAAHLVVRWTTTGGPTRFSKMSAHTLSPKDPGWKLLMKGDRPALELLLRKNHAPS